MDEPQKSPRQSPDVKTVLPDVVHSQQIPAPGSALAHETLDTSETNALQNERPVALENNVVDDSAPDVSDAESISELLPSKMDSLSHSDNPTKSTSSHHIEPSQEITSKNNSLNIPNPSMERLSVQDPSPHSSSWLDTNALSDVHHISAESPVNLALSSDQSKDATLPKSTAATPQLSQHSSVKESPRSEFLDSLDLDNVQNDYLDKDSIEEPSRSSSGSEEIIKLDIRGSAGPKQIFPREQIIFGPPPEGGDIVEQDLEQIPVFKTLLSPFLVGAGDHVLNTAYAAELPTKDTSLEKSPEPSPEQSFSNEQNDLLVEEITVNELKEKTQAKEKETTTPQPKSLAPEEGTPFSTFTEYKTICEEHLVKLVHLEEVIALRDALIEELTISLQRSVTERDALRTENVHLTTEVQQLQHLVCEQSQSEHDTMKAQLSDLVKYESMLKEDSTRFYSAVMSGGSSLKSSNGEKDMDREEIVVSYSRSDLKSSEGSDDFQTGFETKLTDTIGKYDEFIEENLKNQLRDSLLQVFSEEVGKLRLEYDTEVKEVEAQCVQERQAAASESRRLRELLTSVKSGDADVDALRLELAVKHEMEMENLRTYFEKKCADVERSYSEEVWRGKACASPGGSQCSGDWLGACGDTGRRRARSADLPSLTAEATSTPQAPEQALRSARERHQHQLEELKEEQALRVEELERRHRETVDKLQHQITQLKAQIQTVESAEANVSVYQQDIDLELEKKVERVRQEIIQQLQEQIQVLLSDPDAELSSWPLELVALRDKIHADKARDERELTSLRDELSGGDGDKWKQRRNLSFDQNRHIEEVTRERDGLKRVAATLQRVVSQLVAYCAAAEDELNKTVLGELLAHLTKHETSLEDSRPASPLDADTSALSRSSRHVHFAPDLRALLLDLEETDLAALAKHQRDLSLEIKGELEHSLLRLRAEAQDLLELSTRVGRKEHKMLESSQITELVDAYDGKQRSCDNCEMHKKTMEEAMSECLQREHLLRSDLDSAMMKIAQLMTAGDRPPSTDIIAEGYGTLQQPRAPLSLPVRPALAASSALGSQSLDGSGSPRDMQRALQRDLEALQRERDELLQQLESANRQLKSTRQFVEEQAAEREAERDESARRIADARDENVRLATRLQNNARILNEMHCLKLAQCNCYEHDAHVEQLEEQTREMTEMINELEERKAAADNDLKSSNEKISLLRDIIANLEQQLEQKTVHETDILAELEQMKKTIEERDGKMRRLLGELESMRSERDNSSVMCVRCTQDEDRYAELLAKVKEQAHYLTQRIRRRTRHTARAHELCSTDTSEPGEELSPRGRLQDPTSSSDEDVIPHGVTEALPELSVVWDCLAAHARAEDAALKRVADLEMQRARLKDIAEEVRAERDVLQTRMSEQALRISSLAARLETQRNHASALAHTAASELTVQLHDAKAEVQRLSEELEARERQLSRLKQTTEERDKLAEEHEPLYGNSCNPKDKVVILERALSSAHARVGQLETIVRGLEGDKDTLHARARDKDRALAEKEAQIQELLALRIEDEDIDKSEQKSEVIEGKVSARTLSDIVSISEFDEQDLQMRRAELRAQNLSGAPYQLENREKSQLNETLPPDVSRPNISSLHADFTDHFDLANFSPRANSLPLYLTSTQNKDLLNRFKRNVNETTVFGTIGFGDSVKHSTALNIPDNASMYPNRDISDSKSISVEPKKIDFSLEASKDNKSHSEQDFTSFRDLGIDLDVRQENFAVVLSTLKQEIIKAKSELKNAEEQLCEFPALKEEVEELKSLLENTMATMENDKKFYENQLEHFSSNKTLLEQRLMELTQEVNDKSKDLHVLKEDILKRENMILELAKEKRNLTNKMAELEVKIDELKSRNTQLQKYESESHQMREKMAELQKLEQLVSEKNQQIDSLNQHLDRLDDLQRCLDDKTEEFDNLKEAFEEKSSELFQMQDTVEALNRDLANVHEENGKLNLCNKDLKLKLTKLEKEQENQSLKLQSNECELQRVNSLNNELSSKIEELKLLTDKLKDKETEIEMLNEDINAFHEEIATLKEQLKMVSRSPSPRSKNGDVRDKAKTIDRQASNDKKQLVKIRKQISLLQHELDFHKKELNDKAFELARAKLDATELQTALSQAHKQATDGEMLNAGLVKQCEGLQREIRLLADEKQGLKAQLASLEGRICEEANMDELRQKLSSKTEQCQALEQELVHMKGLMQSAGTPCDTDRALVPRATRSPTAELERALRDQLDYSHRLDEDIMEQILSASSDNEEIPRLALSQCSSSVHTSSSDRLGRARAENEKLQLQVNNLEARLKDKDALITELNRIRDKLVQDWQAAKLRGEAERDSAGRLQLLLLTHQETADSLQNQDANMIAMLKKRLESAMATGLELQESVQRHKARVSQLERAMTQPEGSTPLQLQLDRETEECERLRGEVSVLKSKLDNERARLADTRAALEQDRAMHQRETESRQQLCAGLRADLAEHKRLKHDANVELLRCKELLSTQSATIAELENRLEALSLRQRPIDDALTEIEVTKSDLAHEIATLKKCVLDTSSSQQAALVSQLRTERQTLAEKVAQLEEARRQGGGEEKDQAIRYLHGRCMRLESCRKALVWQKRYLQRTLQGYTELEQRFKVPAPRPLTGVRRFKCVAQAVVIVLRMQFLVRRRRAVRSVGAQSLLARPGPQAHTPASAYASTSPPSRDVGPAPRNAHDTPRNATDTLRNATDTPRNAAGASRSHSLARRALTHDLRLNMPSSPLLDVRSPRFSAQSPRDEPFLLSSPRSEVGSSYLHKLELVTRCLNQALDQARE